MTLVKMNTRPVLHAGNLFNEIWNDPFFSGKRPVAGFPAVNIHETKEAWHLELMAPGREKNDFQIGLTDGLLTIGYEAKVQENEAEYKTTRREFSLQSFKRSFHVDEQIDADAIQARYENGILRLLLPKKPEVKAASKNITIQ